MTITRLARPEILALQPYSAAEQISDTTRLNANESPWPSSTDHFRRPLNRYPEVRPLALHGALAKRFGCDGDQILATRGSSEAIDLLIRAFCRPGIDNIVTTAPTFSMYQHYATVQGAAIREVSTSRETDFAIDIDAILAACDNSTRLIFICSPNNPTGTVLPRSALLELLQKRGERSAIVIDEAYFEFSSEPSAIDLLSSHGNVIVLRTLSKALAFAGARCGALIAAPDVVRMFDALQAPYAFATPVVECVLDVLKDECMAEIDRSVQQIIDERERVIGALSAFSLVTRVWPSAANFFLIQVSHINELLQQSGDAKVLLRYFGADLADCVRITVGSPEENNRLLEVFQATEDRLA